jgi:hypothetical protein
MITEVLLELVYVQLPPSPRSQAVRGNWHVNTGACSSQSTSCRCEALVGLHLEHESCFAPVAPEAQNRQVCISAPQGCRRTLHPLHHHECDCASERRDACCGQAVSASTVPRALGCGGSLRRQTPGGEPRRGCVRGQSVHGGEGARGQEPRGHASGAGGGRVHGGGRRPVVDDDRRADLGSAVCDTALRHLPARRQVSQCPGQRERQV